MSNFLNNTKDLQKILTTLTECRNEVLDIEHGGTGATTAEEARENLGITELFAKVGNMYVWGKLGEIPAGYKMLDAVTKKAVSTASIQVTWEYADSITIADDGTISLVNPQSTSFKQNSTIS